MSWRIIEGDCVEAMRALDADSVDAIVTDPPYGLEFMGKEWDRLGSVIQDPADVGGFQDGNGGNAYSRSRIRYGRSSAMQSWHEAWATEALRVLKPGGHLLAFGGTRTYHRLASAIEDAGFEIRDCLAWLYGSGFPKSLDVSKAIDKAAGAEREVVGVRPGHEGFEGRDNMRALREGTLSGRAGGSGYERPWMHDPEKVRAAHLDTAPATDAAREWDGWGTALKPAYEPIVLARKPFNGTVANNVQRWGMGALNVDACRIQHADDDDLAASKAKNPGRADTVTSGVYGTGRPQQTVNEAGRWPANVTLDAAAAKILDEQSGQSTSQVGKPRGTAKKGLFANSEWNAVGTEHNDSGGASRFFYTAKASRSERNKGLDSRNHHPTVKPVDLMAWLCRLITPPGGLICDPFTGSGSTGIAALREGFRFLGIERDTQYVAIARRRIEEDAPLFNRNPI